MLNYESPLIQFFTKIVDMLILGFFWFLTSLPIFTIGVSTSAMYRTTAKVIRKDVGTISRDYFQFFKENFKSGCMVTLVHLLLGAVLVVFFLGCSLMEPGSGIRRFYFAFGLVLMILFTAVSRYVYPLFSRFKFRPFQYFKAALFLCMKHPFKTLLLLICPTLASVVMFLSPAFIFLYPPAAMYTSVLILEPVFKNYMDKSKSDGDAWYWT